MTTRKKDEKNKAGISLFERKKGERKGVILGQLIF